ncbi:hypothetical protein [Noviherbaspirillum autotrophicum]|uniref:hypothetical protein n=1 Tax=Noviherbaspirillum autotrophicum TaxID=709839 RepID=UPI0012FE184D|nr:hypothetical protein [Noviherbaspirillum autotrophicum]
MIIVLEDRYATAGTHDVRRAMAAHRDAFLQEGKSKPVVASSIIGFRLRPFYWNAQPSHGVACRFRPRRMPHPRSMSHQIYDGHIFIH